MTDITDQDRRAARAWAKNWQGDLDADISAAARVILATVDAPEPTLAEELRDLARTLANLAVNSGIEDLTSEELNHLISRAEQIEQERDYWKDYALDSQREVERLTAERVTEPSLTLNDPSMTRLVPAPRVITNHDEAWNLPIRTIIRDSRGETFERTEDGWGRISVPVKAIKWPVTVLWEPEVAK